MKTKAQIKENHNKQKNLVFTLGAIVLIAFISFLIVGVNSNLNYAEEAAKPLENALAASGGIKLSGSGNPGRGPDNLEPYYDSTYKFDLNKVQTEALISKIAQDNGYKLTHASPENRGHLGAVADIYIDSWYFDNTSKKSPYKELSEGNVDIAFELGDEDDTSDASPTVVRVNVQLPPFKK